MALVTETRESKQYDGTNGSDCVAWLDGTYTTISDDGQMLVFKDGEGFVKRIAVNSWLVRDGNRSLVWHGSDTAYKTQWAVI
ncbi:hypothetical protein AB0E27_19985 [Streptomyces sparsogenes]|uniref:hypothetical protein n=1 Tax=Streptomyces sparsogenes TaxID=67365 RepID=UPI0033E3924E